MRMSGRTRGEKHATRGTCHGMDLMSMVEHVRRAKPGNYRRGSSRAWPAEDSKLGLLFAYASDFPAQSTVAEAEASEHAEIWRNSRVRASLKAHGFAPAQQPIGDIIDAKWLFS